MAHGAPVDLVEWLRSCGGICTVQAARELATKDELAQMRADGALWTPLRGWVALAGVRNDITWALHLGGVVSCISAFREHELWLPHGPQHLHVRVNRETHSERVTHTSTRTGVTMHRLHTAVMQHRPRFGVDSPLVALAVATSCIREEEVIAAADSALKRGVVQQGEIRAMAERLPRRRRRPLLRVSEASGSGTESVFALMLRRAGVQYRQQAELISGTFVDFLIGKSLIVEIDSQLWHATPKQQAKDRARDAAFTKLGYRTLRFTYEQVLFEPEYVLEAVLAVVRRRAHLRPPWG